MRVSGGGRLRGAEGARRGRHLPHESASAAILLPRPLRRRRESAAPQPAPRGARRDGGGMPAGRGSGPGRHEGRDGAVRSLPAAMMRGAGARPVCPLTAGARPPSSPR